jgi:dTDP-4-dehydrorhamnose 3,5-epimerase
MQGRFEIQETAIQGLVILHRKVIGDYRGYLERMFCSDELQPVLDGRRIVQINHTLTNAIGALRGMHFQYPPHAETKFVSCLKGAVFDVAIDLRQGSPTFLQWHAEILTPEAHNTFVIPEGFAHGFQTLTKHCEMIYLHTSNYHPDSEGGVNALDPVFGIKWPLTIAEISEKDEDHPFLAENFEGIKA